MSPNRSKLHYFRYVLYFVPVLAIIGGYGLLTLVTQESYPFTIVTGTSMQPTILPGSVALIEKTPFNQLQTGDVIVFAPELSQMFPCDSSPSSSLIFETQVPCFVIHRIVNIEVNGSGNEVITTKGDANPSSIPLIDTNISESMYIGKVVLQLPLAGYVTETPYNEYVALVIFGALIAELYFERKQSPRAKAQRASEADQSSIQEDT
ncbi:MAG TPA: signal peptidase I [Nitrososphaerales archaeon]|nr:signal peptidase I [Nitrososphaerales archaeon]